jgi:hypothetical protein
MLSAFLSNKLVKKYFPYLNNTIAQLTNENVYYLHLYYKHDNELTANSNMDIILY